MFASCTNATASIKDEQWFVISFSKSFRERRMCEILFGNLKYMGKGGGRGWNKCGLAFIRYQIEHYWKSELKKEGHPSRVTAAVTPG